MKICISSGHGKLIRGAAGPSPWGLDEVDEARRVVDRVTEFLRKAGVGVEVVHDNQSTTQDQNLNWLVDQHNSKTRDLDCSIHFNAYTVTDEGMGCECLFLTKSDLAAKVSKAISKASGLKNRGAKKRDDLYFLNKTTEAAILVETAFCDSSVDAELYRKKFDAICIAISGVIAGLSPIEIPTGLTELVTVGSVTIKEKDNGQYVRFISDLDICNDGSGPSHGDPHHQSATAYYSGGCDGGKYLNADKDKYIVVPPQVRSMVPPVVMGCKGRLTNLKTEIAYDGVVGEIGPSDKTGEAAYSLAKIVNPSITYNSGDGQLIYLYELWPGVPAEVDGFAYKLQPA